VAALLLAVPAAALAQRTGSQTGAQQLFDQGRAAVKAGRYDEGIARFRQAIAKDATHAQAYAQLSMTLLIKKRYAEGVKVARDGLRQVPGDLAIGGSLGMNLYKLGRRKEAHKHLQGAVGALTTEFAVQYTAAKCCLELGDNACAVDALSNYLDHRPSRLAKQDYKIRTLLGTALLRKGDLDAAGKTLRQVLRSKPGYDQARLEMAAVYLKKGDCSRAVATYEQLLRKVKSTEIHLNLGQAYLCSRRFRAANKQANQYLAKRRGDTAGLLLRGDAAVELRQFASALRDFNTVAAKEGWSPKIRVRVAKVHYARKEYGKALDQISAELAKAKAEPEVLALAVRAAIRTGKRAAAVKYGKRLLEADPTNPEAHYLAGMAHSSAGKFDQAVPLFEKALRLKSTHRGAVRELVKALCYQARAAFRSGEVKVVVEKMRRAHRIRPDSLAVNRNLALAYMRQGRGKLALSHVKANLRKVPRDYVDNRLAGRILVQLGKLKQALGHLERATLEVMKLGGIMKARALAESAVVRLRLGQVGRGLVELEEAQRQAQRQVGAKSGAKRLLEDIRRNLARAYVIKSKASLEEDKPQQAWDELQKALGVSASLPAGERIVVQAAAAFSAMSVGQVARGKELAKRLRGKMGKVLVAPYNKIGEKLLLAYADYLSPAPKNKLAAARRFTQMARRLKAPARAKLQALARSANEQAAIKLFRMGQRAAAQKALAQAVKLSRRGVSPEQRHNMAVVNYLSGRKATAVTALDAVKARVPLAYCNLAVHHEQSGAGQRAFELFKRCQQARAAYPGLKAIIDAKRRVFGGE
jgi:tetratricopeptide (TPR) repeat protein